ncbi:MAG: hypothetical protein IT429_23935 [Gemmataceae bacterium]|nr:hypothetical protein [Gemmataceae bacterium]
MRRVLGWRDCLVVFLAAAVTIAWLLFTYGQADSRDTCRYTRVGGVANECL